MRNSVLEGLRDSTRSRVKDITHMAYITNIYHYRAPSCSFFHVCISRATSYEQLYTGLRELNVVSRVHRSRSRTNVCHIIIPRLIGVRGISRWVWTLWACLVGPILLPTAPHALDCSYRGTIPVHVYWGISVWVSVLVADWSWWRHRSKQLTDCGRVYCTLRRSVR